MRTLASAIVQIEDSIRTLTQHGIVPKDVTMSQKTFDLIMLDVLKLGMTACKKSKRKTICGLPITIDNAMQPHTLLIQ